MKINTQEEAISSPNTKKTRRKSKIKNAIGLSLIASISFGMPVAIVPQNVSQKKSPTEQIDYDYDKVLHMPVSELSDVLVKKVMLQRLNEIRKENNLPPMIYDYRLEQLALQFASEKTGTKRWEDPYNHFDKNNNGLYNRMKSAGLREQVIPHVINKEVCGIGENLVSTNGSVYGMMNALMKSPGHSKELLSIYTTRVGFGYDKGYNILVQIFADVK